MKCELIHDHFQNFRSYGLPKAQLIIADIPYNISADFYASRPSRWKDGKIENGASCVAGKAAFNSDYAFNLAEYFHFCSRMLRKEPQKGEKDAPCMIVFCSFEQISEVIAQAQKHGFKHSIPLVFIKSSGFTENANMTGARFMLLTLAGYSARIRTSARG